MRGLSQIAYRHIRQKLLTGGLRGGSMLSETTLAKEIGISRTPVREAIAQLEREGLLDQIPRYGTFVRVMSREEMEELYDFRVEIEGFAAARSAQYRTEQTLDELRRCCSRMMEILRELKHSNSSEVNPKLAQEWMLTDASFHTAILHSARNRWIAKSAADMRLMVQIFGRWQEMPGRDMLAIWARTWKEHRRLVRALACRDSDAAREIIRGHILKGKEKVLEYYDWAEQNRGKADSELLPDSLREHLRSLERYALISHREVSDSPNGRPQTKRSKTAR